MGNWLRKVYCSGKFVLLTGSLTPKFTPVTISGAAISADSSLANYQRGVYSTYSELFGAPELDRYHTYTSAYAQDSWRVNNRLTMNYGLRYDVEHLSQYQGLTYGSDRNNFGPRFAMSYDVSGDGKTLLEDE